MKQIEMKLGTAGQFPATISLNGNVELSGYGTGRIDFYSNTLDSVIINSITPSKIAQDNIKTIYPSEKGEIKIGVTKKQEAIIGNEIKAEYNRFLTEVAEGKIEFILAEVGCNFVHTVFTPTAYQIPQITETYGIQVHNLLSIFKNASMHGKAGEVVTEKVAEIAKRLLTR